MMKLAPMKMIGTSSADLAARDPIARSLEGGAEADLMIEEGKNLSLIKNMIL